MEELKASSCLWLHVHIKLDPDVVQQTEGTQQDLFYAGSVFKHGYLGLLKQTTIPFVHLHLQKADTGSNL